MNQENTRDKCCPCPKGRLIHQQNEEIQDTTQNHGKVVRMRGILQQGANINLIQTGILMKEIVRSPRKEKIRK